MADDARAALVRVEAGEADTLDGWLAYGAALNEGRAQFPSNEKFGQWVKGNLPETEQKAREAAMWGAEYPEQLAMVREAGAISLCSWSPSAHNVSGHQQELRHAPAKAC